MRDADPRRTAPGGPGGSPTLAVVIVASPVEAAIGQVIHVTHAAPVVLTRVAIGPDEDARMSREHATVERARGGMAVVVRDGAAQDDGAWKTSANQTWLGGKAISGPVELTPNETFVTGRTLWMVVADPAPAPEDSSIKGISAAMERARNELQLVTTQVALRLSRKSRVSQALLVTGPRGTGKQVVAREAHRLLEKKRKRDDVPFRQVSAPALADGTTAADLFGVVDRYATDVKGRPGYFVQADGGVLFLDEIGDTPVAEQAKLLNVLQEREVTPLGGKKSTAFDCLVVAATNQDLSLQIRDGSFRADLYDRLGRFVIDLPPLDVRKEDIPPLTHALVRRHGFRGPIAWEVVDALLKRSWPGNVRELDAFIERMVAVAAMEQRESLDRSVMTRATPTTEMAAAPLPADAGIQPPQRASRSGRKSVPPRDELLRILEDANWNKTEVGRRYGKHPRQVGRWIAYLGLEPPE